MTVEEKAEEYLKELAKKKIPFSVSTVNESIEQAFKDGYEYFDKEMTDLLNSYGIRFMDCNSFGGVIALHCCFEDVIKENEELKVAISKKKTVTEKSSEVEQAFKQGQESMLFDFAIGDRHTLLEVIEEQKSYIKTLEERICSLRRKNASLEHIVNKLRGCRNCKKFEWCLNHNKLLECGGKDWELGE